MSRLWIEVQTAHQRSRPTLDLAEGPIFTAGSDVTTNRWIIDPSILIRC